ncbi:MAG: Bacterial domain, partial [Thermomicrobiales bacterium]|nr:Bacterial domain [Thermomicrobiales bacterium]
VITRVNEATPAPPTATAVVIAPTPGAPPPPTATSAPALATTQAVTPTPAAAAADPANPCASLPVYSVGAVVATTAELNLREGPSTDSAAVAVLPEGSRLQVTGEFQEAGQCDWWPVTVVDSGQSGFVIEQYLEPAPE